MSEEKLEQKKRVQWLDGLKCIASIVCSLLWNGGAIAGETVIIE